MNHQNCHYLKFSLIEPTYIDSDLVLDSTGNLSHTILLSFLRCLRRKMQLSHRLCDDEQDLYVPKEQNCSQ